MVRQELNVVSIFYYKFLKLKTMSNLERFGKPLSREEMRNVNAGKFAYAYSTCTTTCDSGGSVSSSCAGGCGSSKTATWCNGSDGSKYNENTCGK